MTTLGVREMRGYSTGTGVWTAGLGAPGVLGTAEERETLDCVLEGGCEEGAEGLVAAVAVLGIAVAGEIAE